MEKFTPSLKPFLDEDRIKELLEGLSSGTTFLVSILRDQEDNGESFPAAARLESVARELADLLGEHPAVLNQEHPRFKEICHSIHTAAEAGHVEQSATRSAGTPEAKSSLLLVPARPADLPPAS